MTRCEKYNWIPISKYTSVYEQFILELDCPIYRRIWLMELSMDTVAHDRRARMSSLIWCYRVRIGDSPCGKWVFGHIRLVYHRITSASAQSDLVAVLSDFLWNRIGQSDFQIWLLWNAIWYGATLSAYFARCVTFVIRAFFLMAHYICSTSCLFRGTLLERCKSLLGGVS